MVFKTRIRKTQKNTKTKFRKTQRYGGANAVAAAKAFKRAKCAPKANKNKELQKFTCYSENALFKMRDQWNTRHKDAIIIATEPKEIWLQLKNKMENACHNEACWLKQKFAENNLANDKELTNYTFAPKSPEKWKVNHTTWLNSTDIEKVMKQYEHAFPFFRFIGPTPIDFDKQLYENTCVWDDLCKFDLAKFVNAKPPVNKIGIIFNTDPHDKSGAHWISMFIDLKKKFIFFFDSNGTPIPKQIEEFKNRVVSQALDLYNMKLVFDTNEGNAHQKGNTECGMYSLYLIVTLLRELHTYKFFKDRKISDAAMESLRDEYYNSDI
jgi:hypothetical protein